MSEIDNQWIIEKCLNDILMKLDLSDDQLMTLIEFNYSKRRIEYRFLFLLKCIESGLLDLRYPDGSLDKEVLALVKSKCNKILEVNE